MIIAFSATITDQADTNGIDLHHLRPHTPDVLETQLTPRCIDANSTDTARPFCGRRGLNPASVSKDMKTAQTMAELFTSSPARMAHRQSSGKRRGAPKAGRESTSRLVHFVTTTVLVALLAAGEED